MSESERLLEEARSVDSPLHSLFTWDNAESAVRCAEAAARWKEHTPSADLVEVTVHEVIVPIVGTAPLIGTIPHSRPYRGGKP